ncbi:MAG TPA: CPBP family intramembrane glutamic endopeptidase [Gemmatimonadales bacterium]
MGVVKASTMEAPTRIAAADSRSMTVALLALPLATFLGLTFASSGVFWWLIIAAGTLSVHGGAYVYGLMWCPGLSALVTRLIFQGNVRGEGWRLGRIRWAVLAYLLPIGYATAAYAMVWLAGLGRADPARFHGNVTAFVVLGSIHGVLTATGEELGWRGFLVPALARTLSLGRITLVSGVIWAVWHMPLIILADYNAGTATWYALLCFTAMVLSLSLLLAWLRLRSGSVWPAALLHASHNLYIQGFFDTVTVDTGPTRWLTGEFGAALAVTVGVTAWVVTASRRLSNRGASSLPL